MAATMTVEEAQRFHQRGCEILTNMAIMDVQFEDYAGIFESRGGADGMGPEFGTDTEVIIGVYNDLKAMLTANNNWNQIVIDKNRVDY